jgi:hypothetical protein
MVGGASFRADDATSRVASRRSRCLSSSHHRDGRTLHVTFQGQDHDVVQAPAAHRLQQCLGVEAAVGAHQPLGLPRRPQQSSGERQCDDGLAWNYHRKNRSPLHGRFIQ